MVENKSKDTSPTFCPVALEPPSLTKPPALAQDKTPLPFVCKNSSAFPSVVGKVKETRKG